MRQCSKCKKTLPDSEFWKQGNQCKQCRRNYNNQRRAQLPKKQRQALDRAHYERNIEYKKARWIQVKYGLTPNQVSAMMPKDGLCPICKKVPTRWAIDHDHETGRIRGLLCLMCNSGLGFLKDSVSNLRNAIVYLEQGTQKFPDVSS